MTVTSLAQRLRGLTGLRGRIVGVVLVTTVATLAIASALLLGPLEHSLRNADKATLKNDLRGQVERFRRLPLGYLVVSPSDGRFGKRGAATASALADRAGRPAPSPPPTSSTAQRDLQLAQTQLGERTGGGTATVLASDGADGAMKPLTELDRIGSSNARGNGAYVANDDFSDAAEAYLTNRTTYTFGSIDGTEYARVAIPFTNSNNLTHQPIRYVLGVRKSIGEIPDAVRVVTRAFLEAAAAGLVLTLILGVALSGRLVARLRRLRRAAIDVEHDAPTSSVPVDLTRDEVGDLARSLAAMQRRLQRQEEARRAFVATASHELRTPLTSLDGMLELLGDDLRGDDPDLEDARALVRRARAQSRRLGRLAADLLDLSRMDAQVQLRSEPVELGEISRAVLAEFELGSDERGIDAALQQRSGAVWALGDPGSIARILRILLDNAVRVTPPGAAIRVRLGHGQTVTLSVCDQGPGVREDEREAIFQRFTRGRDTGGQAGFGLGLAIGRELARRMGGDLILEPATGEGATFTLRLPIAHAADRDEAVTTVP